MVWWCGGVVVWVVWWCGGVGGGVGGVVKREEVVSVGCVLSKGRVMGRKGVQQSISKVS